jgi:UDP-N-acetylglucosamine acyltransferase
MSKVHPSAFIHPTAIIGDNVEIGENVEIGAYCVIGEKAEHPHIETNKHGRIIIGSNTTLTKLVTIDCPLEADGVTKIGEKCYLMAHSHVGHDAELQHCVTLSCGVKIGGHSIVRAYSTLGLNSTVHQRSIVPKGSMVGANAFFKNTDDFKSSEFRVWVGVPAINIGSNWRLIEKLQ